MSHEGLRGKIALVTGGSRGLGAASARRLASAGADVAVAYVRSAEKVAAVVDDIKDLGVRCAAFRADQADFAETTGMVEQVVDYFGHIDILVNSAGVFAGGPMGSIPPQDMARLWNTNVHGLVVTTQAAVSHMPDGGRIINFSSIVGERAYCAGFADYGASKAALSMYSRSWAHELAPRHITVNTLIIAFSDTDMGIPKESELGQTVLKGLPFHRYATPAEVAGTVAFLASAEASYITGANIRVDGGWNA